MEFGSDRTIGGKTPPSGLVQAATGETVTPWDSDVDEKPDNGRAWDASNVCDIAGDEVG
jgi:hypothetical protein